MSWVRGGVPEHVEQGEVLRRDEAQLVNVRAISPASGGRPLNGDVAEPGRTEVQVHDGEDRADVRDEVVFRVFPQSGDRMYLRTDEPLP
eukprot:12842406-Heterocapsa_arctica.AAC.1